MKSRIKFFSLLGLALMLLPGLSGCSSAKPAGLSNQQVAGITENILKAIDANDYQQFSRDFSDSMKSGFTEDQFNVLRATLQSASGGFVSLDTTPSISNNQGYAVYIFSSKYTKETVYVTITFLIGAQKVEGLFFDSANLRKAPK
ncbi:MAG: DUF3887 domain-containing protein [Anaerolineales bacterium]